MATFGPCVLSDWDVGGAQTTELIELVLEEKNRDNIVRVFFPQYFYFLQLFVHNPGPGCAAGQDCGGSRGGGTSRSKRT